MSGIDIVAPKAGRVRVAHVINIHDDDMGLCVCAAPIIGMRVTPPKSEKRVLLVIILAFLVRGRGCSSH